MRLETIHITNFGSYVDAEINLKAIAAAVICGPNGAGKSTAFVDAPLWTLFGKCRTDTDQMIRLGADVMSAAVTFALNGQRYRVVRTRSLKTKAGKSELQLHIEADGSWTPVSGSRLADTQQKILSLLNSDYDLLVATGVLVQGQADRFSRATPSERKAILAQILRLDAYAGLKTAANREVAVVQGHWVEKTKRIDELEAIAKTREALQIEASALEGQLATLRHAITQHEAHLDDWTSAGVRLQAKLDGLAGILRECEQAKTKRQDLKRKQGELIAQRDRAAKILENRAVIEAKVLKEAWLKHVVTELQTNEAWLSGQLDGVAKSIQEHQALLLEGTKLQQSLERAKGVLADVVRRYRDETRRLQEALDRDEQACGLLTKVPCSTDLQGQCQFTIRTVELQKGLPERRQWYAHRAGTDEAIAAEVASLNVDEIAALTDTLTAWEAKGIPGALEECTRAQADLRTKRDEQHRLRREHEGQLSEIAKFTVLLPELRQADVEHQRVCQDLEAAQGSVAEISTTIDRLTLDLNERPTLDADLKQALQKKTELTSTRAALQRSEQDLTRQAGQLAARIAAAEQAEQEAVTLHAEFAALERDRRQFQLLSEAYALIPVLILEQAIPLLEQEANGILGKISPSGMRVTLTTQKALKGRDGLAETLDILVRDVSGERPYESFSGGERARLDLALRVGLSKLLAHRAGARMETLIVDEAFAPLDAAGVEAVLECLPRLSEEFSLVLFITHDDTLKTSVGQQIVVSKNGNGSQVEVCT